MTQPIAVEKLLPQVQEKYDRLRSILAELGGCVVAFSGGVDSTFLFAVAADVLGDRVVAVTATSHTYPERELREARELAGQIGGRHREIVSEELDIPEFRNNPPNRCYYCKRELFGKLRAIAGEEGFAHVVDGANIDDRNDHRPGRIAAREVGVRSPLEEAGFGKDDIRQASRMLRLPTWQKQAFACLSSRFPHGIEITAEKLAVVEKCENLLHDEGFKTFRVRAHGDLARIEVGREEIGRILDENFRDRIHEAFQQAGFRYVSLDLAGYRTGSMNPA
ncbi:MAG: ATP-dependent sacrificial sulfur transferase LarE [Oryzomonas sp.]|uniref:ATP-dependent sacrificial sulfur transferase LarE n=1 Tax=Oryzomonas sp. TaxID=2855186 RepID=UPI00284516E0|nr:ATP-dependent sacrificial sulfur transferase LarE [Oryzomonas sp.]MDR3579821.1 ATP-dependent sacrificial sulfur transferase LarE [Oryzomonas sp.]